MGDRVKRRSAAVWGVVCTASLALYAFNRFWLKRQAIAGSLPFLRNHFNDLLAPVFVLSLTACTGTLCSRRYRLTLSYVLFICCAGSLAWEYGARAFGMQATFDLKDIVCYFCGGLACYLLSRLVFSVMQNSSGS